MTLTEALPHLISAAAFNNSPSSPLINPMKSPGKSLTQETRHKSLKEKYSSKKPQKPVYYKSLKPNAEELKKMNLKKGKNSMKFEVMSRFQGLSVLEGYFYDPNTKLVISDIDGTITASDIMGHIMYMVGMDWCHKNVCDLFTKIKNNGYEILYLSTRNIGLFEMTKNLIVNLSQDGSKLPEGPIIVSPDRLFAALKREVILNRPHEYKITALLDIKNLFPDGKHPFYAGFGNKVSDATAYRGVDVLDGKIFLIDTNGEITQPNSSYHSTYKELSDMVNEIFPATSGEKLYAIYNEFNYWKVDFESMYSE